MQVLKQVHKPLGVEFVDQLQLQNGHPEAQHIIMISGVCPGFILVAFHDCADSVAGAGNNIPDMQLALPGLINVQDSLDYLVAQRNQVREFCVVLRILL